MNKAQLEQAGRVFLHEDEVEPIERAARSARNTIVEIGTAFGGSAALLLASSGARVHSIDPFVQDPHSGWRSTAQAARNCVREASLIFGFDLDRWTLHEGYSYDVVKHWRTKIDLLFIDGDHSYTAVKQDFDQWFDFIVDGGLILLHDSRREPEVPEDQFARGWPGPTQLADELAKDPRVVLIEEAHSLTIWRKQSSAPSSKATQSPSTTKASAAEDRGTDFGPTDSALSAPSLSGPSTLKT